MYIGSVDKEDQKRIKKRAAKSAKNTYVAQPQPTVLPARRKKELHFHSSSSSLPSASQPISIPINMSSLSGTLDRYNISDRAGAAIATAVLVDLSVVTTSNTQNVIDRSKVRRDRVVNRQQTKDMLQSNKSLFSLYFDGRKDKTMTVIENRRKLISEEHIVLIAEPKSRYIGHVVPITGSSKNIIIAISDFLVTNNFTDQGMYAVGCDGTNVNTGVNGGVIVLWERQLQRPLQWLICQLHANELPLRHLMHFLDGDTSGPRGFCGPIGKSLADCNDRPVQSFQPIRADIPIISKLNLSSDQQYLYDICQSVVSGVCSERLAKRETGKIVHSRWVTLANRILRTYVSTSKPSDALKTLATFIVKVYAPCWFNIKCKQSCTNGAKHVHDLITRSRYLPDELKKIIDPVIERNGYFLHCENILLAMLFDEQKFVRQLAYQRIKKARCNENPRRKFVIPPVNFEAVKYYELIPWQDLEVTEPPVLSQFSLMELEDIVMDPLSTLVSHIVDLPCHTQAVERAVKTVTEVSASVSGPERRDGMICAKIHARNLLPSFETKKDFKP